MDKWFEIFLNKQFSQETLEHTIPKKELFIVLPYLGISSLCLRTRLQKSINSNISICKIKIIFKPSTGFANFFRFKDRYVYVYALTLSINLRVVDAMQPLRWNLPSFKVRIGEHSVISPLTNKRSKSKKATAAKDHMLISDQPVSFDEFKVLASSNSEFHLKIKESLLISHDQPILNKKKHLCHYICLVSYRNILQSYNYLVSSLIHCYSRLLFSVTKYMLH